MVIFEKKDKNKDGMKALSITGRGPRRNITNKVVFCTKDQFLAIFHMNYASMDVSLHSTPCIMSNIWKL